MKRVVIIILIIAIVGLGLYWLYLRSGGSFSIIPSLTQKEQDLGVLPKVELPEIKLDDPSTYPPEKFITLKHETDVATFGDGYRSYLQNTSIVKLAVTVPEPANQSDYKGWLIRPSDKKFIPLGSLERRDSSQGARWVLSFTSDKEVKDFSDIVVTVGSTVTDPNKAQIILRGQF